MVERRKVSAALTALRRELAILRRLDDQNQSRFFAGPGRPSSSRLTKRQMMFLSESILARAFTQYERFLEEVFVLYCQGKVSTSGMSVGAYIIPKDAAHARDLIKSGMTFLEWNSPDNVLKRSDIYLHPGNPVYLAISTNKTRLSYIRKIRNAIAHLSLEAEAQLRLVFQNELGVLPLKIPTAGEFLIMSDRSSTQPQYYLRTYLDVLENVAIVASA